MNKLISYSLYGTNLKYFKGAIKNSLLANEFFQDWDTRFYCGSDVPHDALRKLEKLGSEVLMHKSDWHPNGMFWRYYAAGDSNYEYVMFRDVDSRFNSRDVDVVHEWLQSKQSFHIIRDHPFHMTRILGGLFGLKNCSNLSDLPWYMSKKFGTEVGQDQKFLATWIYPKLDFSDVLVHDEFFHYENKRIHFGIDKNLYFMGESYDEYENYDPVLRRVLEDYAKSTIGRKKLLVKSFLVNKLSH